MDVEVAPDHLQPTEHGLRVPRDHRDGMSTEEITRIMIAMGVK